MNRSQYTIATDRLDDLQARITRINNKGAKFGWPAVEITLSNSRFEEYQGEPVQVIDVEIASEPVRIEGWTFIAKIENGADGNIVKSLGEDAPEWARHTDRHCDHCGHDRQRKYVYVIRNEAGEYMQVGRTCLKDFGAGHDAAQYAEMLEALLEMQDEDWMAPGRGRRTEYVQVTTYLYHTASAVLANGWVSRAASTGDNPPTSEVAYELMLQERIQMRRNRDWKPEHNEAAGELASATLAWLRADDYWAGNDYLWNLRQIGLEEYVGKDKLGYLASAVNAYMRAMNKQAERREQAKREQAFDSHYVGQPKDRIDVTVTVTGVVALDSAYGVTMLHIMRDEHGNLLKWFATSASLEVGSTHTGKATVKKHELDRKTGEECTIVTRCKFD